MDFRKRLASSIGIDLEKMDGFTAAKNSVGLPWDKIIDPIKPLLDHSDCDGELSAAACRVVAPRLRQLVADWPVDDYDKIMALRLADGMDAAGNENVPLQFT
jgi:hypothetical protein